MPDEPTIKRTYAFVDGQNLYHAAKEAFGYSYPNYDIKALTQKICKIKGWQIEEIRFYSGIHRADDNPFWHHFWSAKLAEMGREGIKLFTRPLHYRDQTITLPDESHQVVRVGQEKGIDVRIALDIVRAVRMKECDVVLVFSQDQDLSEVAEEIRIIAKEQDRWVKIASSFPLSSESCNRRGINYTDWIVISREIYDDCIDLRDYRPKGKHRDSRR